MVRKLLNKIFSPKVVRVPTGIIETEFERNGKKYLLLIKVGENGEVWRKHFLIQNLLNEKWEVTEQTIAQEKDIFTKLPSKNSFQERRD